MFLFGDKDSRKTLVERLASGHKETIQEITELYTEAKYNNSNVKSLYQRVAQLFFPNSNNFYNSGVKGVVEGMDYSYGIYDSTPLLAGTGFVNFFKNTILPAGVQNFEIRSLDKTKQAEADKWTNIIWDNIYNSNFDRVSHKYIENLCIGTGGLKVGGYIDGSGSGFVFKNLELDTLHLEVDIHEFPNMIFYTHNNVTDFKIKRGWGQNKMLKLPEYKAEEAFVKAKEKKNIVEFCIYLDTENNNNGNGVPKYLYGLATEDFKHFYLCNIIDYQNMFATRFETRGSIAPYGYAPPINVLSTAEDLQNLKAVFREGTEYSYKPFILGTSPDGSDAVDIRPEPGVIKFAPLGTNFTPIITTYDPNGTLQEIEGCRSTIRDALMTEVIQGVGEARYVTAEAVALVQRQFINKFAGSWGAIQNELIIPLARACVFVLSDLNLISTTDLSEYEIVAKNPISKDNEWKEIDKIVKDFQTTAGIIGPELALEKFDIPKLVMKISDIIGTDKTVLAKKDQLSSAVEETKRIMRQMAGGATGAGGNEQTAI